MASRPYELHLYMHLWPCLSQGVCSSILSMVTGRFLVMTDLIVTEDKSVSSTARDNLVNECTNMGR